MLEGGFLAGAESVDVQVGRAAGHRGEFLPRDELAVLTITSMLTVMVMTWRSR